MVNGKRDTSFDILKGIGILFVVIGHTPTFLTTWIYGFHMPLFIFVAGYFYKHSSFVNSLKKGLKHNMKPWGVFCITSLVMLLLYLPMARRPIHDLSNFVTPLDTTNYLLFRTIWFLPCLFMISLFYSLIRKVSGGGSLFICLMLYCIDCIICLYDIHLPFFIDTVIGMIAFYAIGYEIKMSGVLNKNWIGFKRYQLILFSLILLCIYTILVIWLDPKTDWKYNIFDWYNFPLALIVIAALLFACKYLAMSNYKKTVEMLALIGRESLVIMGLHSHFYDLFILPIMLHVGLPLRYMFIPMLVITIPVSIWMNAKFLHLNVVSKRAAILDTSSIDS